MSRTPALGCLLAALPSSLEPYEVLIAPSRLGAPGAWAAQLGVPVGRQRLCCSGSV